jgi:D-alanyl-D-alanine carboxypeptidase
MMDNTSQDDEPVIYSRQQRRYQVVPQYRRVQPQWKRHSDEHPEIPKVRRASLFTERTAVQAPPAPLEDEEMVEEEARPMVRPRRLSRETSKVMVAYRRRETESIPVPPPQAYRTRQPNRPRRSLQEQFVHLAYNQPTVIVAVLLILVLIVGTLMVNLNHAQQVNSPLGAANGRQLNLTAAQSIQQAADPHELVITPEDTDHPPPPVFAASAYLLDADTGATLYAYNPFMHLPMMSTTKLMTALLAAEEGNPDQKITITPAIANDISQLSADSSLFGVKQGETYTLRELLYGLLLPSGNDAAIAIGDALAGNLPNFVAQMNARAQQLGLHDTHYMNPHGLLETGHYSSAHDLAILGAFLLSKPLIHQISGTETYVVPQTLGHPEHDLVNGNQFLFWYPGVDAGKPGWDGAVNFVQVVSCVRNHHHLIGVTMHTSDWWTDMRDLMNWGFDDFKWVSPSNVDFTQNPIPYAADWNYFAADKPDNTIPTANSGRYYIYTGFSVSGPFLTYYDSVGGLQQLGYPTSMPKAISSSVETQSFEHGTIRCDLSANGCSTV